MMQSIFSPAMFSWPHIASPQGYPVTLFEADDIVGGISRTPQWHPDRRCVLGWLADLWAGYRREAMP